MRSSTQPYPTDSIPKEVEILDTTLRDGAQSEGVTFSLQNKLSITRKLDEFGFHLIEGGWPNPTNPKELKYFQEVKKLTLNNATITAFGMTRRKDIAPSEDEGLRFLLDSGVNTYTIFGKSWETHITHVLETTREENIRMISDSVRFLMESGGEVVYDAEHFYDGFKADAGYALRTIRAAEEAGAKTIVLCDTRGGTLPHKIYSITRQVLPQIRVPIGVHMHNDAGFAVANTLFGVMAGASHVQGTINGIGERAGNADLIQVIGNLELKLGVKTLKSKGGLRKLTELSSEIYELAHLHPNPYQPYVGRSVFSHKGGVHGHAVSRLPEAYEHIDPHLVGNERDVLASEQAGRANIEWKAREFGLNLPKEAIVQVLKEVKRMEDEGYQLENADANLYLLMRKSLGDYQAPFEIVSWRAGTDARGEELLAESSVKVRIGGDIYHRVADGVGPVNALDDALRSVLLDTYPQVRGVKLQNFNVVIVDRAEGTESTVRVFVEFADDGKYWTTVGVSKNILEASRIALSAGYEAYLKNIIASKYGRFVQRESVSK